MVKKPKLDQHHYQRCGASFTCLDCSQTFNSPDQWRPHTTCVSEAQKYERSVWQGDKKNGKGKAQQQGQSQAGQQAKVGASAEPANATNGSNGSITAVTVEQPQPSDKESKKESKASKRKRPEEEQEEQGGRAAKTRSNGAMDSSEVSAIRKKIFEVKAVGRDSSLKEIVAAEKSANGKKAAKKLKTALLSNVCVRADGTLSWTFK